jgi:hypothetical protein
LLIWSYIMVVTQSVPKRIFMMCGHERSLMALGIGEALLNLALSVLFIRIFHSVVAVAVASLIATVIFGCFYLWPWAAREAGMSIWGFARVVWGPGWVASLPLLILWAGQYLLPNLSIPDSLFGLAMGGSLAVAVAAFGLWRFGLSELERARIGAFAQKLVRRGEVL